MTDNAGFSMCGRCPASPTRVDWRRCCGCALPRPCLCRRLIPSTSFGILRVVREAGRDSACSQPLMMRRALTMRPECQVVQMARSRLRHLFTSCLHMSSCKGDAGASSHLNTHELCRNRPSTRSRPMAQSAQGLTNRACRNGKRYGAA